MLFYLREKGQGLEVAITTPSSPLAPPPQFKPPQVRQSVVNGMKKRKAAEDENKEDKASTSLSASSEPKPFIGPLLPSPTIIENPNAKRQKTGGDPQADMVKRKIEALKIKTPPPIRTDALKSLTAYDESDDDDEDNYEF